MKLLMFSVVFVLIGFFVVGCDGLGMETADDDDSDDDGGGSNGDDGGDPGVAPGLGDLIINEFLADPAGDLSGDANGDGVRDASDDEFIEIVNMSSNRIDLEGVYIDDGVGTKHIFGAVSLDPGKAAVVFGGGSPALGLAADIIVVTASTGSLSLNNGGDTISIYDNVGSIVNSYTYGAEGGNDVALTLEPDMNDVGSGGVQDGFVLHSTADITDGSLFSPGTLIDGTVF